MDDSTSERNTGWGIIRARSVWIMLPLITFVAFAQALMRQGLPVVYPFIQEEFSLSRAQVGLISAAMSLGFSVAVLFGGWFTDTLGVKRIVNISLFGMAALILLFPVAYSFPVILVLVTLIGIASAPIMPATTRAVMDWIPRRVRALAMSFKQMGIPVSGALTAAVLPALTLVMGWRIATATTGLLVLLIGIAFILLYRDAHGDTTKAPKFNLASLKTMMRNRSLVTTMVWYAIFSGFQRIVLTYLMLFVMEKAGYSAIVAGGLLAASQVASIIARVGWGAVSDFVFGGRRVGVLAITGFLSVLWMVGAAMTGAGTSDTIIYLIAILMGVSTLSYHGVANALIGEQSEPGQVGTTMGMASTMLNISQTVMPPLFGYLVDVTSYSLAWNVSAVLGLLTTLALLAFDREPQHR